MSMAYLAFSVPALAAGVATANLGLHTTALVYCVVLVVDITGAVAILWLRPATRIESTESNTLRANTH